MIDTTPPSPPAGSNSTPRAPRDARALLVRRSCVAAGVLLAGVTLAACGSSGSSTITVGNESKADNALIKSTGEASKKTEPSESTKTATTPTSGPLSKEPKVTSPGGPNPTKLEVKDLIAGTGTEAAKGDHVTVNYVGVLFKNSKEFDASWKRKEPFSFTIGGHEVIKGWEDGVVGMKVGGRRELVIPPALGYGIKGSGSIPPNAPLVFVIDLLSA